MFRSLAILLLNLLLFTQLSFGQSDPGAVILQYHNVSSSTAADTRISPENFRTQMQFLRDNQFAVLPLEEVIKALKEGTDLPIKTAVITFDDGYRSVYDTAFPLLKSFNWPFTVFVTTGLVASKPGSLYANWDQLREMGESGGTLANHTVSHLYMIQTKEGESEAMWLQRLENEITEAGRIITEQTGQDHKLLAYPYGEYNAAIKTLITRLGYTAFGQHSGPINSHSDFAALPRFPLSGAYGSMNNFATKMNSKAFNLKLVRPDSPVTTSETPEALLDFEGEYRFDALSCFFDDKPIKVTEVSKEERQYLINAKVQPGVRRYRYNCTAPGLDGRYFWHSVLWINPTVKG
ncbi:MAG: polysaccharide deacetylase family protein [Pseudomonadota bacterium]